MNISPTNSPKPKYPTLAALAVAAAMLPACQQQPEPQPLGGAPLPPQKPAPQRLGGKVKISHEPKTDAETTKPAQQRTPGRFAPAPQLMDGGIMSEWPASKTNN